MWGRFVVVWAGAGALALGLGAPAAVAGGSHGQAQVPIFYTYDASAGTFDIEAQGAHNGFDSTVLSSCTLTVDKVAQTSVSYFSTPDVIGNNVTDGHCEFSAVAAGNAMAATGVVTDENPLGTGQNFNKAFSLSCRKAQSGGCSGSITVRIGT